MSIQSYLVRSVAFDATVPEDPPYTTAPDPADVLKMGIQADGVSGDASIHGHIIYATFLDSGGKVVKAASQSVDFTTWIMDQAGDIAKGQGWIAMTPVTGAPTQLGYRVFGLQNAEIWVQVNAFHSLDPSVTKVQFRIVPGTSA